MNMGAKSSTRTPGIDESLSIELTTRCNSPCSHCFARASQAEDTSLSTELVHAIIDEGLANGYRHLHLTGGEPLLWAGLFDLLDNAFLMGYQSIFLNTNGILITEAVARRLAQYEKLVISISLQGPEKLHDQIRGQGSYLLATNGVQTALNAGVNVTIFTTIGRTLLKQLPHFAEHLFEKYHGISRLTLIQLIRVNRSSFDLDDDLLAPEDFLGLVRIISALNLYGLPTDVLYNPLVNVAAAMSNLPQVPKSHALYRQNKLFVRANRAITHAHSTLDNYGRYKPGRIRKVLISDHYNAAAAPNKTTCPACPFVSICRSKGLLRPA